MTVGTHSLRKTGFLFAIFGIQNRYHESGVRPFVQSNPKNQPIEDVALLKSARHHAKTDTSTYHQDALTLYADYRRQPHLRDLNRVSGWESIWVANVDHRKNTDDTTSTDMNIIDVATFFVKKELGINITQTTFDGIMVAAEAKGKKLSLEQEFEELFGNHCDAEKAKIWAWGKDKKIVYIRVHTSADMEIGKKTWRNRFSITHFIAHSILGLLQTMTMTITAKATMEMTETMPRSEKSTAAIISRSRAQGNMEL
jgi:hypothetical protein